MLTAMLAAIRALILRGRRRLAHRIDPDLPRLAQELRDQVVAFGTGLTFVMQAEAAYRALGIALEAQAATSPNAPAYEARCQAVNEAVARLVELSQRRPLEVLQRLAQDFPEIGAAFAAKPPR